MSSIFTWFLTTILNWFLDQVFKYFEEVSLRKQLEAKDVELLKKYDDIVKAGETFSRDERRRLAESFLNDEL